MDRSKEPAPPLERPADTHYAFGPWPGAQVLARPAEVDPNNPPWGVAAGVLTWLASVALLFVVPLLILLPYVIYQRLKFGDETQLIDQTTALFIAVLATIPTHLLTFGIVWAVVTRFGKRPFWRAIGWEWSKRVGFWTSAGLGVLLLAAGLAVTNLFGGDPTPLDRLIQSSTASRITLAVLAATTGPFVEELVYRGVLYPTLERAAGRLWAILSVSILFVLPHLAQYYNNLAVICVISALSLALTSARAFTGRLLPSFVIHLIFNGIQSIYIIVEPYLHQAAPDIEHKAPAAALMLAHSFHYLF